jgi:RNA polymerase sigma-70 factor (ECF subfamily)
MQATLNFTTSLAPRPSYRPLSRCSAQELLDRSQAGDLEARHELVGRYRSVIQATASRMSANRNDADDLAAEIYLHVFNVVNSCKNVQTLPGWIKRIAINEFYQSCRRERRRPQQTSLEVMVEAGGDAVLCADESENPATIVMAREEKKERSERLAKALHSLPDHHRELCDLYYAKQRSFDEIARETGLAIGTIKSRLFRARESMQRKLGDLIEA